MACHLSAATKPAARWHERSTDQLLLPSRLPRWFGRKMQRKLDAGAGCEDLRTRCPYFYTVAQQLSALCTQDRLAPFVMKTFTNRYKVGVMRSEVAGWVPCGKAVDSWALVCKKAAAACTI